MHLETCDACRAFERLATSARSAMQQAARLDAAAVDWEQLKRALGTRIARDGRLRMTLFAIVLVGQLLAILMYSGGRVTSGFVTQIVITVLVFAGARLVGLLEARRLRAYERSAVDLFFFQRVWTERRLWLASLGIVLATLMAFVFIADRVVNAFTHAHHYGVGYWVGAIWMACLLLALSGYLFFVRRPQLKRELDAYRP